MHLIHYVGTDLQTILWQNKFWGNKQACVCMYVMSMGNLEIHTAYSEIINV